MGFHKETVSQRHAMEFDVHETYTNYEFHCDAVGCDSMLELDVLEERCADDYDIDLDGNTGCVESASGDYEGDSLTGCICGSARDALRIALTHGWDEGDVGIQRGHIYCPKHKEVAR